MEQSIRLIQNKLRGQLDRRNVYSWVNQAVDLPARPLLVSDEGCALWRKGDLLQLCVSVRNSEEWLPVLLRRVHKPQSPEGSPTFDVKILPNSMCPDLNHSGVWDVRSVFLRRMDMDEARKWRNKDLNTNENTLRMEREIYRALQRYAKQLDETEKVRRQAAATQLKLQKSRERAERLESLLAESKQRSARMEQSFQQRIQNPLQLSLAQLQSALIMDADPDMEFDPSHLSDQPIRDDPFPDSSNAEKQRMSEQSFRDCLKSIDEILHQQPNSGHLHSSIVTAVKQKNPEWARQFKEVQSGPNPAVLLSQAQRSHLSVETHYDSSLAELEKTLSRVHNINHKIQARIRAGKVLSENDATS